MKVFSATFLEYRIIPKILKSVFCSSHSTPAASPSVFWYDVIKTPASFNAGLNAFASSICSVTISSPSKASSSTFTGTITSSVIASAFKGIKIAVGLLILDAGMNMMKKNKKFQKDQLAAEGYTEILEFFAK